MKIALRVLTAVALIGVAVVHLRIAHNYTSIGTHPLAISDQFYAQAALAFLLSGAGQVSPAARVWGGCALFAIGARAGLGYSGFQESWAVEGAKLAAWFEGTALGLSLLGGAWSAARPD